MTPTASTPASITLLCGDDSVSREKARRDIVAAVLAQNPGASLERFDPANQYIGAFVERMLSPSLFQTAQLFIIRDVHLLEKEGLDWLSRVFSMDIPDVFLIMETDRARGARTKERSSTKDFDSWTKAFSRNAASLPAKFAFAEFMQPPEYNMGQWLQAQTPLLIGRSISKADAEHLVNLVGADSAALYSELQKIDLHLPPKKPVDKAAIDAVAGAFRLMSQFELAQAVGKKDLPLALEIIESLYASSPYVPLYISALSRHFWALLRICAYEKVNPDDIRRFNASLKRFNKPLQEETGLRIGVAAGLLSQNQAGRIYPVMVKPGIVGQALSFGERHCKKILRWLYDYDIGIKTGRVDDSKTGFQLLCYKIAKAAELENQ